MTKSMKILALAVVVVSSVTIALAASFFFSNFFSSNDTDVPTSYNEYVIDFDSLEEKIYIRARAWGLAGNHEEIILSNEPIKNKHLEYFYDKQFIFLSVTEIYYRKANEDTLEVYVDYKSEVPPNFRSKVKIKQIEFKDLKKAPDMKANPEKYGLTRVSVYEDN